MKNWCILTLLALISACNTKPKEAQRLDETKIEALRSIDAWEIIPQFQTILDSAEVEGCILVYDVQNKTFMTNDSIQTTHGYLPASTFKITNSIIALETGVVESDTSIFEWNGEKRRMQVWEQDLTLHDAFHVSCVPCYQDVARRIGPNRMNAYLDSFNYGSMVVDSSNIDVFWLEGESQITAKQQINFLKRFYDGKLPISNRTHQMMKQLMVIQQSDSITLSGKTGWSIRNGNNVGWFVGYLEKNDNVYFFATNVLPQESFNMDLFGKIRKEVTEKALRTL